MHTILYYLILSALAVFVEVQFLKRWHNRRHMVVSIVCGAATCGVVASLTSTLTIRFLYAFGVFSGEPAVMVWGTMVPGYHPVYIAFYCAIVALVPVSVAAIIYQRTA